jgi:hypothetical protein
MNVHLLVLSLIFAASVLSQEQRRDVANAVE